MSAAHTGGSGGHLNLLTEMSRPHFILVRSLTTLNGLSSDWDNIYIQTLVQAYYIITHDTPACVYIARWNVTSDKTTFTQKV